MTDAVSRLEQFQSPTPSRWREAARERQENKTWLRYSQHVAMMMLDRMEAEHISQRELAERMGCSQQYVSKLLRGRENLSIETLCKIQDALTIQILEPMMA